MFLGRNAVPKIRFKEFANIEYPNKEFEYGRIVVNDIGDGIISQGLTVFTPVADYDLDFWKYEFSRRSLLHRILSRSTNQSKILKQKIAVPSLKEQQRIGAYFKHLDSIISLEQSKGDELKTMKKFMLQNMIPQTKN